MEREIIKIDRDLCNGCGICVPNCHEGALQIIDEKAVLVSELMCDGLGACIGHCPQGAITIEHREAEAYDEIATIKEIVKNGKNTVIAHLTHLKDHNETDYLKQGVGFLKENVTSIDFDVNEVIKTVHNHSKEKTMKPEELTIQHHGHHHQGGCPGSREISFAGNQSNNNMVSGKSELRQWPVQMHLINPMAGYFQNADVVIAADCVAFSLGNFHQEYLKGKSLAIACPKLDSGLEIYLEKTKALIENAKVNTITVLIMEVPCCGGLSRIVSEAVASASRKVPVKQIVVGIQGEVLDEQWL